MRRWIQIFFFSIFLMVCLSVVLILSGLIFKPFIPSLERFLSTKTASQISLGGIRLASDGDIVFSDVTVQKTNPQPVTIPQIQINPRWKALLKKEYLIDQVQVEMGQGSLVVTSDVPLMSLPFNLKIKTRDFPIHQIAGLFVTFPPEKKLEHTGEWRITGDFKRWEIKSDGRLEQNFAKLKSVPEVSLLAQFEGDRGEIKARVWDKRTEIDAKIKLASFGAGRTPSIIVDLKGHDLQYGELVIKTVQGHLNRNLKSETPLALKVMASSITWTGASGSTQVFSGAQLTWAGNFETGNLRVGIQLPDGTAVRGDGPAVLKTDGLLWRWEILKLKLPSGYDLAAAPGSSIDMKTTGQVNIQNLRLGEVGTSLVVNRFSFQNNEIILDARADNFFFERPVAQTEKVLPVSGVLNGEIHLKGPLENPVGVFNLRVSSGSIGTIPPVSIRTNGTVGDSLVTIQETLIEGEAFPPIHLKGTVPWAWLIGKASNQLTNLAIQVESLDPAVLLMKYPDVEVKAGGSIQLAGRIAGRKEALKFEGTMTAFLPAFKMPTIGVDARDAHVSIELKNKHLLIRQAEVKLGKGTLQISGESDLPSLHFDVRGNNVILKIRRQLEIKTDFNLALRGSTATPLLTGEFHVDQGTYEVRKKKKDEDKKEPDSLMVRTWDNFQVAVKAMWENNVWYRDGLTKIETQADLDLLKDYGQRNIRLKGQVNLLRGSYDAYGRDFIIRSGELTFREDPEINPFLSIQATHTNPDAVVELDVKGTAKNPELQFRSTPPMAEQDILAMLAVGRMPSHLSDGDDDPYAAAGLAADVASDYLTREMRSAGLNVLDLDVIRVSPTDQGKQWTVGRYLGTKLFLSYSYNPENSASQVLNGEYTLSPRWTIVGQSGSQSDNYLDLNFRLPVGKDR